LALKKTLKMRPCVLEELRIGLLLGKRALIAGEVLTGKTRALARILAEILEKGLSNRVTVLDFAPNIKLGDKTIGAPLAVYLNEKQVGRLAKYLWDREIRAPRL
jgi:ATP-dependent exoDNAse (exonuclease V) alpha subunit